MLECDRLVVSGAQGVAEENRYKPTCDLVAREVELRGGGDIPPCVVVVKKQGTM
jgi:hypothetical protein